MNLKFENVNLKYEIQIKIRNPNSNLKNQKPYSKQNLKKKKQALGLLRFQGLQFTRKN